MASSWCFANAVSIPSSRAAAAIRQRLQILLIGQWASRLRRQHELLSEVGHDAMPVGFVECDHVCQREYRSGRAETSEVGVRAGLEFVQQYLEFGIVQLLRPSRCTPGRAWPRRIAQSGQARFEERVDAQVETAEVPRHADPSAPQAFAVQAPGVVTPCTSLDPHIRAPAASGSPYLQGTGPRGSGPPAHPAGSPRPRRSAPSGRRCPGCGRSG